MSLKIVSLCLMAAECSPDQMYTYKTEEEEEEEEIYTDFFNGGGSSTVTVQVI